MAGRQADWTDIGLKSWLLGCEAAQVMWLRGWVIASGGAQSEREARRMIEEKVAANSAFCWALATGAAGSTPAAVSRKALRHYGGKVRANSRRLKR
jgi:hypothetical protein